MQFSGLQLDFELAALIQSRAGLFKPRQHSGEDPERFPWPVSEMGSGSLMKAVSGHHKINKSTPITNSLPFGRLLLVRRS